MRKVLLQVVLLSAAVLYGIVAERRGLPPAGWLKELRERMAHDDDNTPAPLPDPDVKALISVTPHTVDSMRALMIDLVFGPAGPPTVLPDTIAAVTDPNYADLRGLDRLERFVVVQEHDIRSVGYIFHPLNSNGRLMLYHQGHDGDFIHGKHSIAYFVERGFTVYAFCMPLIGLNNQPVVELGKLGHVRMERHGNLQYLDHPIRFFMAPVTVMLNHAERMGFTDVSMTGISGGGWTTTMAAALDVRIKHSFPVAGTYPMFIRFQRPDKNMGDFEQWYAGLVPYVDYLDMYVLGASGEGRSQVQCLNTYDPCCFDGDDHSKYSGHVADAVRAIGAGSFRVYADPTLRKHDISMPALDEMARELGLAVDPR